MASLIDIIECPQCGGLYSTDYYYRTGEEYRHCVRCGRYEEYVLVRGEDGKPVKGEDEYYQMEHKLVEGLGSAKIALKNGFAQISSLTQSVDQGIIDKFHEIMEDPDVDKDESYLSSWDSERKELVMIYGKMPETYAEFNEKISKEESSLENPQ